MNNNKLIVHDPVKKVLWKFIVRADSLEEAKKIIQEACPELDIEKGFIHGETIKQYTQQILFKDKC